MKRRKNQKKFSEQFSKLFGNTHRRRVEPKLLLLAFVVSLIIWTHVKEEKNAERQGPTPKTSDTDTNLPQVPTN